MQLYPPLYNSKVSGRAKYSQNGRLWSFSIGLKSLNFCSDGEVDTSKFPLDRESNLTSDCSESEYGEDSTIFRESTPSLKSISEFEDTAIHTATQDDDSQSEDEKAVRDKPPQWIDYLESEDIEVCNSPQRSASDVDEEEFNPELRELYTIYECNEEFENDQNDDEPLEANTPEPQQLSPVHQSLPEFDDDEKDDEPLEAGSPELQRLSSFRYESPIPEFDDDEMDEKSEADSPAPR